MTATLHDIVRIVSDLSWNSDKDFALGPGQAVSPQIAIEEPSWSLYSLDVEANRAWFVELPPGTDLSTSVFAFRDQRRLARRLLEMSLDDLINVAKRVPEPGRVVFIFSIGRCGSTLVSHVLNTAPRVWSLSEPISFPRLLMTNYDAGRRLTAPRKTFVELIRACTKLQFRPLEPDTQDIFALKFHSQCLFQAELYFEAFPDAAYVFLYRDALTWAKSWYQMAQKYSFPVALAGDARGGIWDTITAADDRAAFTPYIDMKAPAVPLEDELVIGWARCMEEYSRLLALGVPFFALRYNELNRDRETSLSRLFAHCGLPEADALSGLAAFDRDSQAGDVVSSDVEADAMTPAQVERARSVLARRTSFADPELMLADVYSPA